MNCTHHMWEDPTGTLCTRSDAHDETAAGGHVYESGDGSCTNPSESAAPATPRRGAGTSGPDGVRGADVSIEP